MKRGIAIDDYLKPLATNPLQCYLTNTLQVADVVEWVLNQIGKSSIWQTSFSISEEFLRRLYFISKSGRVETIRLVLDFKATNKTLRLWAFLTQVIEHTYLADNHSKVILIRSVKGDTVSIRTSHEVIVWSPLSSLPTRKCFRPSSPTWKILSKTTLYPYLSYSKRK